MKPIFIALSFIFAIAFGVHCYNEYKDFCFRNHYFECQVKGANEIQLKDIRNYYYQHGKLLYIDLVK